MSTADDLSGAEAEPTDFDQVVEQYSSFVYNVAFKMMGQPEDAEDVAQDAFISAYRGLRPVPRAVSRQHLAVPNHSQRGPDEAP